MTGQPDTGKLEISYVPDERLIETKSFKLFLQSYRDKRMFNEAIVAELADKILEQSKARYVEVVGTFGLRGGVFVRATASRYLQVVDEAVEPDGFTADGGAF